MRAARLLAALIGALIALSPSLVSPGPALACSCMEPRPIAAYAADGSDILSGRVVGRDGRGVQVAVERWFAGQQRAPVAWIAGDFGNGASCGVGTEPPVGSEWIWVAWRPEPTDDLRISICTPFADLSTPEGQALLAEAIEAFGPASVVDGGADPQPSAPIDPVLVVAVAGVLAAGLLVLGGVLLIARRRPA